jgi:hypothetical protein
MIYMLYRAETHFTKIVRLSRRVHEPIEFYTLAHINRQIRGEWLGAYAQSFSIRLRLDDVSFYALHFLKSMYDLEKVAGTITIVVAFSEGDVFNLLRFCKKHQSVSIRFVTTEEVRVQRRPIQQTLRYFILPRQAPGQEPQPNHTIVQHWHLIIPRRVPAQDTHLLDLQDVIDQLIAAPKTSAETRWSRYFDSATKELIVVPSVPSTGPWLGPQPYVRMVVKASEKAWWLFATTGESRTEFVKWQERTGCPVAYGLRLE